MISTNRLIRYLWLGVGITALSLGTAGIVLPLLPTVPFYILAAFCFAKGSDRLHRWFQSTKLYQKYVVPFNDGNGMTWQAKLKTMVLVTAVMSVSGYFLSDNRTGLMMLGGAWLMQCAVMVFFIKTRRTAPLPADQCAK